jgi:hypothetical protein
LRGRVLSGGKAMNPTTLESKVNDFLAQKRIAVAGVSLQVVEYCRQHDISVIAGACPMMFGEGVDFGHTCMRWMMKLTGGLPT